MQELVPTIALLVWPVVSLVVFATLPFRAAVVWTLLGAQLLLPVGSIIKFQMIPVFDKATIPCLVVLAAALIKGVKRISSGRSGFVEICLAVLIFGPIITSELNSDPIVTGGRYIAGVGLYDAISALQIAAISLIPFFIGRWYFRDIEASIGMLRSLVFAMAAYSLLLLFEVRFSPQLHYWVYGYYPSDFIQAIRSGEYRPMAFMGHGLIAARFVLIALLAAVALWSMSGQRSRLFARLAAALTVMVYFCRTFSAILYAVSLGPLIAFAKPRTQIRIAVLLAALALIYPTVRAFNLFPTGLLLTSAGSISEERTASLQMRFDNEDALLSRAFERPLFGWGRYGRNRVYDENTGADTSVTDGQWIITLGQFGLVGFAAQFGLLCIGIFRAPKAMARTTSQTDQKLLAALTLMLAITVIDLLPNSGLEPWTWLMCGALIGRTEALLAKRRAPSIEVKPTTIDAPLIDAARRH